MSCRNNCGQCSAGGKSNEGSFDLEALRGDFDEIVKTNLGDVPVMDGGRYISPKINNYWILFTQTVELLAKKMGETSCPGADKVSGLQSRATSALIRAAFDCGYLIEDMRIVLHFNPKAAGRNALEQLGRRLDDAAAKLCDKANAVGGAHTRRDGVDAAM